MAKARSNEGTSKSDIVREYMKGHPTASVAQIVSDLKQYGISQALAQKIKYKDNTGRGRRPRKARAAAAPAFSNSATSGESKADSIRRVAQGMGKRVRPRDVIAALRSEGTDVSFAQVGQVLRTMGMRRRRRGRRAAGERATAGRASHAMASTPLSLEALIAAKKLADQLGSVQAAKQAMDALAKLS